MYFEKTYVQVLIDDFGITVEEAWRIITFLNKFDYCIDSMPDYNKKEDTHIFKRMVNGTMAYIKVRIEEMNNDSTGVCISFHKDC